MAGGRVAQVVEHLLASVKPRVQIPDLKKKKKKEEKEHPLSFSLSK
jgi:hypothetical protein